MIPRDPGLFNKIWEIFQLPDTVCFQIYRLTQREKGCNITVVTIL